jgi:peptide chain release factor subunit 1
MPTTDQLAAQLDRLASFDAGPYPVVSLYLNLQPNAQGRDQFEQFLRKELDDRVTTYPAQGPERDSLQRDAEKIRAYLANLDPAANGLALFAASGADLFEAVSLAAPIDQHRLFISDTPHLYPLVRLLDEYPRYAALVADTNSARIFVFALNKLETSAEVEGVKTKRHKMGGWSQARYQRHVDNLRHQHAKEVVDVLARIVRDEQIAQIVLAGDEVAVPVLRAELPKDLAEKVVDVLRLDIRAPEHEVLDATIAALREKDAADDRERVDALVGAYRAGGLGVVGAKAAADAFELGQVDELLLTATGRNNAGGDAAPATTEPTEQERAMDDLLLKARQTAASVRFIEDATLLAPYGGVGAFLRFKL